MKICIIVPIYKSTINIFEQISLNQLFTVLSKYQIFFIMPESMKIPSYISMDFSGVFFERFSDSFFENRITYSELLLTLDFYKRFDKFDYILIHQLDAFIFSDQLTEYAKMGYDYLGAPICDSLWREYHVGNGGLSLRKVHKAIKILQDKASIIKKPYIKKRLEIGEDNFWAYCGINENIDFSVPDIDIASRFSTQSYSYNGIDNIKKNGLPFGTHHFPDWNYDFWRKHIVDQGYKLPKVESVDYINTLPRNEECNKQEQFLEYLRHIAYKEGIDEKVFGLSKSIQYCLWGAGEWGYLIYSVLNILQIEILDIFDMDPNNSEIVTRGVKKPIIEDIRRKSKEGIIIQVSANNRAQQIETILRSVGLREEDNYNSFDSFKRGWDSLWIKWRNDVA